MIVPLQSDERFLVDVTATGAPAGCVIVVVGAEWGVGAL